ncbi:hypothetical protein PCANC_26500, partial [Puccinia coronata f. sp. avenae]
MISIRGLNLNPIKNNLLPSGASKQNTPEKRNSFDGGADYFPSTGIGPGIAATQHEKQQPKLILSFRQWKQNNSHNTRLRTLAAAALSVPCTRHQEHLPPPPPQLLQSPRHAATHRPCTVQKHPQHISAHPKHGHHPARQPLSPPVVQTHQVPLVHPVSSAGAAKHTARRVLSYIATQLSSPVLNRSGPGHAQTSSLFQANVIGNDFARSPLGQQQLDSHTPSPRAGFLLKHGSVIRLVHVMTGRNLHTHTIPAPITTLNNKVAGYGNATVDDSNSYWMIEV